MTLNSRTALVTGGGSGIGRATCLRLAREGRSVGVLGIDGRNIAEVAREITRAGGKAIPVQADVSDRAEVNAAVASIREALGPITILINNAAIESFCPFPEISEETWDRLIAVNLTGVYFVAQAVHHDNFDMWNSKYQPRWNAGHGRRRVGPDREPFRGGRANRCTQYGELHRD